MNLKLLLTKTLLVAAGLCAGANGAWGDEANLTPTADTYFSWASGETTNVYGTSATLYCGVWQHYWHNSTSAGLRDPGPKHIAVFKFDVSSYKGKITTATFKVTGTNPSGNSAARSIYLGYFDSTDWTEESSASNSGMTTRSPSSLNIHPFVDDLTENGSTGLSQSIAKGVTTEVSFSHANLLSYLNSDEDGIVSLIIYGLGQECSVNSKEAATGKPVLELTYTNETLYTATFTENNSLSPTVTIYSNEGRTTPVTNGTLIDGTKYYYRAVLAGYEDYEGSFTVSGANPSVNFTMTAKTAVISLTVNYKDGEDIVFTDNQSVAGLYVGEAKNVPYRMYVSNAGKLYRANKQGGDPYYGKNTDLAINTVVDIPVTEVDLGDETLVLLEDLDDTDLDGSATRASYGKSYGNKDYTSGVTLEPGVYTFIVKAMNKGRGSSIAVGSTTVCTISDIYASNNSWTDKTFEDVEIPVSGQVKLVKGGSNTIDYYDIIIAIRTGDYTVSTTLGTTGYSSFASSYALNLDDISGATPYYVSASDVKNTSVSLTEASGTVAAGTGLILKGTAGATVTIPVVASGTDLSSTNKLVGCPDGATITSETANYANFYVLGASVAEFQNIKNWIETPNTLTIPAGKAYLDATGIGAAPSLTFDLGGGTTGIDAVNGSEVTVNGEYYNLAGQRVAQPTKGLYIVNGKKVLVKNSCGSV